MTRASFVIANLLRKKMRIILTVLSLTVAFLLFGLLQAVDHLFYAGADDVGVTRLLTQARVSFTQPLPLGMLPKLEAVPGVTRVSYSQWFGGMWQDNTPLFVFAVDPQRQHDAYPEFVMPEPGWRAFAHTRTAMVAGRELANQYGWKVGQKIPLSSSIYPQKNGSKVWTFDLVGIFDGKDETWQQQTNIIYINHDYFDEANAFGKGHTNFYIIKLADGAQADTVIRTVDTLFENSPDETKTQTESDFNAAWVKQIGDIGTMVRWVLFAVFFTLLLVVGNTMAQGVRERVGELAVLKTLGFTDSSVLRLVFAEAITVCGVGGMLGLVLATIAGVLMEKHSGGEYPIRVDAQVWLAGTAAIVLLGIASGLLPALRAQRLQIVDALAGR